MDESGFRPLPAVVRTYAPVREWLTWDHLSAISAITPTGEPPGGLVIQEHAFKGPDVVGFLQHLLDHIPGKLLVVWDGISTHRCCAVKDFLSDGAAQRVWLEQLPGYAPELNPDEGIWSYLKGVELRNLVCLNLEHLHSELEKAVERLKQKPDVIRSCFREAECYTV